MTAVEEVQQVISSASRPGFWGSVQIDYQDGIAVVVRKTETLNLKKAEDNRRHHANQQSPAR